MLHINPSLIRKALTESGNAITVAKMFGITKHQVYHFAKTRKIELRQGRPQKHPYQQEELIKKIKKVIINRGGLKRLSIRTGIPYHVITNLSKKIKGKENDSRVSISQKGNGSNCP
jgi:hypothetical protein